MASVPVSLSPSLSRCLCLCPSVAVFPSLSRCVCLSRPLCLSISVYVSLSLRFCPSLSFCFSLSLSLSLSLATILALCLSVCRFVPLVPVPLRPVFACRVRAQLCARGSNLRRRCGDHPGHGESSRDPRQPCSPTRQGSKRGKHTENNTKTKNNKTPLLNLLRSPYTLLAALWSFCTRWFGVNIGRCDGEYG